ncbi:hypothetical protein PFLUV_G00088870 [Perca fluviatilis]|uniref:Uncharacterized protein n=1 Tax=Perca fluviatilis TaxID=8168 RepID=A0A6A5F4S5_PERFL|nr:hypothetical protein PFLUV_G00088870 [Perca fluviatilis]
MTDDASKVTPTSLPLLLRCGATRLQLSSVWRFLCKKLYLNVTLYTCVRGTSPHLWGDNEDFSLACRTLNLCQRLKPGGLKQSF